MKLLIISAGFINSRHGGANIIAHGRAKRFVNKINLKHASFGMPTESHQISLNIDYKGFKSILYSWWKIIKIIFDFKPNRIEVHNIPIGLITFFLFPIIKVDYFYHGPAFEEAKIENQSFVRLSLSFFIENMVFILSHKVFSISPFFLNKYLSKNVFLKHKFFYKRARIMLPINPGKILTKENYDYFICCRRLVKRTGVDLLLYALRIAYDQGLRANTKLYIVGSGEEKKYLISLCSLLNLNSNVIFMENISENEKFNLYSNSLANIVPSKALEGFGMVILEAAFLGVPSIVTNIDNMPWVIKELENIGTVCKPDPQAIAESLLLFREKIFDRKKLKNISRKKFGIYQTSRYLIN